MSELITIELPEWLFGEGATVQRLPHLSLKTVLGIKNARSNAKTFKQLARAFPEWEGLTAVETGQPIKAHPKDDPDVFFDLDQDQFRWFLKDGLDFTTRRKPPRG